MLIRALQSIVIRDSETGELTSIGYGRVADVDAEVGNQLVADGLAEENVSISPSGTLNVGSNGVTDVLEYSKVNVNVPTGGGGSSDFSTAQVTINATDAIFYGANYFAEDDYVMSSGRLEQGDNQVILYNGSALLAHATFSSILDLTISGNIEDAGDGFYIVTGDCTITRAN